ncbi:MAG: aminoacyl-tRNA hydrolase [Azospirillum brasilense]|nr:MAG: aminoacyl-tRNA hydrolase [Azospirillum brasilense]
MLLVVGLGNPGAEYAKHRHNVGFMAVDALAEHTRAGAWGKKFHGELAEASLAGRKLLLLKPQTYMNNSGRAVKAAAAFYKIPPQQILVLHDELDLPVGKMRIKKGGGANGQNGIRDIDACLGPDYWRCRIGIGHPGDKARVHGHVLGNFSKDEVPEIEKLLQAIATHFALFMEHSPEALMSKVTEALMSKVTEALSPPRPAKPKPVDKAAGSA